MGKIAKGDSFKARRTDALNGKFNSEKLPALEPARQGSNATSRARVLEVSRTWPWRDAPGLLAAGVRSAHPPGQPATYPYDPREEAAPAQSRAGARPEQIGQDRHPPRNIQTRHQRRNRHKAISSQSRPTLDHCRLG